MASGGGNDFVLMKLTSAIVWPMIMDGKNPSTNQRLKHLVSWKDVGLKHLRRACRQRWLTEHVNLHYIMHIYHPLPSTLYIPNSFAKDAFQEDNTMTEREVWGVTGRTDRDGAVSEKVNSVLPGQHPCLIRSTGWVATKQPPTTHPFAQGQQHIKSSTI